MTDSLLEWMSFRRAGRADDLPTEYADSSASRIVDDLAVLGHLEVVNGKAWRIAPPVLAELPRRVDGCASAVLCGARTHGVLAGLSAACESAGAQMTLSSVPGRPAVVRVAASSSAALSSVAYAARLAWQHDAAFALLACTPAIRDWPRTPCAMVGGRVETVRRFSRSRIRWVDSTLAEATAANAGFFRIKRDWDWVSLIKTGVSDCAYIDDDAGRLIAAAKLRVARWTRDSGTLDLPNQLFPPVPIARALTLCTGVLPQFEQATHRISFAGITPEILRLTLAITGLKLV